MKSRIGLSFLVFCLLFEGAAFAQANDSKPDDGRAGMWEAGIQWSGMSSQDLTGIGGSRLEIDSETGWGITLGYNYTNRFAFAFDANWSAPNYRATRVIEGTMMEDIVQSELDTLSYQFKTVFNFLDRPFTPFVELGAGWIDIDSNILINDNPPGDVCWLDPWVGNTCADIYDTYRDIRTTYTGMAGLRWDLPNGLTLKGTYVRQEIDTSRLTEDASFDTWRLEFIWRDRLNSR